MTIKEWLNRGEKLNEEIDSLLETRDAAFEEACGTTVSANPDKVQTNLGNAAESKMIRYAEFSRQIDEQIDRLIQIKSEILLAIRTVDDSICRRLLIERYLNFRTWEEVANIIHHGYDYTRKELHSKALGKIKDPQLPPPIM